jgi:hypothetical protein
MKIKLKVAQVVNGGVWAADSIVETDAETARVLIQAGIAEAVETAKPKRTKESKDTSE